MTLSLKTPEELEKMRVAGQLAAQVLEMIEPYVQVGVSTGYLDQICHNYIVNTIQAIPAPLNYKGFPKSICTSINHVICHGIPSESKILKKGDIVNIDITVIKDGFHGDTSKMFILGKASPFAEKIVRVTQEALYLAIETIRPGAFLGDIGAAIEAHAKKHRLSIVKDYCGHGIGRVFHEDPQVLHYGKAGTGIELQPGLCFTIEPMLNEGTHETRLLPDGWTVITKDRKLSAQWEHTLAVTETGVEVLTKRKEEFF
jgi:methionyl aminopeptidase